jgi:hypothetical protein
LIQFFFLSNLFKNRLFPFNNNKWAKKAVLENPKNFKKKKKRSKEEIDVEEEEVKKRERTELCVRSSHKMMSSSNTARVPHSPPPSSRPLNSTGRRVPFGQIVERRLARPHSRPRESVITGAHRHRSNFIYAQCDNGVGRGLGPF